MTGRLFSANHQSPSVRKAIALLSVQLLAGCGGATAHVRAATPDTGRNVASDRGRHAEAPARTGALSDEQIARAVSQRLSAEGLDTRHVRASAEQGIVVLRGWVAHDADTRHAVTVGRVSPGARGVIDYLHVGDSPVSDSTLTANVQEALHRETPLASAPLQVSIQDGFVTLQGAVASLRQKRAAESATWTVYGVTGLHDAIRVVPAITKTDASITQEVRARLNAEGYGPSAVQIATQNGVVTLRGEVGGIFDEQRVLTGSEVDGVVDLRNELRVRERRAQIRRQYAGIRSAAEMRAAIMDAYELDPRVPERAIHITVRDGVAELTGSVATEAQSIAASEDAANTTGIWAVENRLTLTNAPANDAELRQRLKARLVGQPSVDAADIDVNVDRGFVVLTGKVLGSFQSKAAERTAQLMPGVTGVDNRLELGKPADALRGDDDIRRDIETALGKDSRVDSSQLKVTVEHGVATISGMVESWPVYDAVLEDVFAASPSGVVNQLTRRKPPQLLYQQ